MNDNAGDPSGRPHEFLSIVGREDRSAVASGTASTAATATSPAAAIAPENDASAVAVVLRLTSGFIAVGPRSLGVGAGMVTTSVVVLRNQKKRKGFDEERKGNTPRRDFSALIEILVVESNLMDLNKQVAVHG